MFLLPIIAYVIHITKIFVCFTGLFDRRISDRVVAGPISTLCTVGFFQKDA